MNLTDGVSKRLYRLFSATICLAMGLTLPIGSAKASPPLDQRAADQPAEPTPEESQTAGQTGEPSTSEAAGPNQETQQLAEDGSALVAPEHSVPIPRPISERWKTFAELPLWEDGLSEMSYYDASCILYDTRRKYTRVHLMNRQFLDVRRRIKPGEKTEAEWIRPVFKMIIAEEIPTENYNYRFLTTVFLERPGLEPVKVAVSSQDWCGTTLKHLTWERFLSPDPETWFSVIISLSYFPDEGDQVYSDKANVDPYEALFLLARAVVAAGGEQRPMRLLKSMRTNHGAQREPTDAVLKPEGDPRPITVGLGTFDAQRVVVEWTGAPTWLDVETVPPYRLLAFRAGDVEAQLRYVERGPYWDRSWKSGFYRSGHAP